MNLMTNEENLMFGDYNQITLTTHRVRQENKGWGNVSLTSIMLEEVVSCQYARKSRPMLLIIGLLLVGFGIYLINQGGSADIRDISGGILLGGVVLIVIYLFTRKRGLFISSASASIVLNTKGMKDENIKQLIDRLEEAKNNRLLSLKRAEIS